MRALTRTRRERIHEVRSGEEVRVGRALHLSNKDDSELLGIEHNGHLFGRAKSGEIDLFCESQTELCRY